MTEDQRQNKNKNIGLSMKATMLKRMNQTCRVYTVKIDESSLSKLQKEQLKLLFLEAKWIYNYIISQPDVFNVKIGNVITKKNKDFEDVEIELKQIGSQMKQSVVKQVQSQIKTLSSLKRKGNTVGHLKHIKEYKSLNLKQYGTTYRFNGNKVKLQNIKGWLRVNGLKQIHKGVDMANAKILNTPKGYYLAITTFIDNDKIKENDKIDEVIGVDFGCKTSFTLSNGEKINASVQESDRLRRLQRKFAHQKKGSERRYKTLKQIKQEYQKLNNKKNDIANKIVSYLSSYKTVVIQDEQISKWKIKHGNKIQHSVLGRVKEKLKIKPNCVVLNKYLPTTKLCTKCGTYNDSLKLSDRVFVCPNCGDTEDRDIHAAQNMVWLYENNLGGGRTEVKRVELQRIITEICCGKEAVKREDHPLV